MKDIFFLFAIGFGAFGALQGLSGNLDTGAYFIALGAFNYCIYLGESKQNKPEKTIHTPCPHGHEDWNDCPDCCH